MWVITNNGSFLFTIQGLTNSCADAGMYIWHGRNVFMDKRQRRDIAKLLLGEFLNVIGPDFDGNAALG
jgi:hypothetical protein